MGKRCLDVGCNAGLVSLAVAAKFGTAAMLGLDIDGALVHQASVNLSRYPTMSVNNEKFTQWVILCTIKSKNIADVS